MKRFIFTIVTALIMAMSFPLAALAADSFEIAVQDPIQALIATVFVVLSALGTVALVKLFESNKDTLSKLGIDEKHRDVLQGALDLGLNYAKNIAIDKSKSISNPTVKSEVLADALNYVLKRVPDAVDHFGLSDEDIREMILARFEIKPEVSNGETPAVSQ